eukprot:CAMPEP_0197316826 /NCGR_PEP_ID=MMETSP0891-20130614/44350_1 /TAXON_ID=44058 ORGANISM="Aureoumbra lagunensis, Strain CCMP1510" /NCGR_SAMPLE_ID=MMETSP0891 /ASSEMBLY_ACC=CAM_ASM_000534 /LENGTH=787 /DNA_ID=CAMNT_0042806489 /DNA_START=64 /DNA_END=2427 /DNA_ORIENTATION=-
MTSETKKKHRKLRVGGFSKGFSKVWKKEPSSIIEDDGYNVGIKKGWPLWDRLTNRKSSKQPGALILVRHGESVWNSNSTFTGWADPDLSPNGERENEHAARLLLAAGYQVDVAYTSRLKRAIRSTWIILRELGQVYRPVFKSWRLNERCYGALTGLSKPGLALELGEFRVQAWRHGLRDRPPPMHENHSMWPGRQRRYADLPKIPTTESLLDTMYRTLPLWETRIEKDLLDGNNVMVVAHANSLRGLIKYVDSISDDDIVDVSIPNGCPLVYKFERSENSKTSALRPIISPNAIGPLSGEFLEKKGALRAALARESELALHIPGYDIADASPALRSLAKLELDRRLIDLAGEPVASLDDDGSLNSFPKAKLQDVENRTNFNIQDAMYMGFPASGVSPVASTGAIKPSTKKNKIVNLLNKQTSVSSTPSPFRSIEEEEEARSMVDDKGPLIIIIRHGKTTANILGIFTGWEDVPLAAEGRKEAIAAGKLLRRHGIDIDVVYTSWLSRAIETAWLVLTEMDSLWIPLVKSWRLNERHYGSLTGLSKKMIAQIHGEAQFKLWRRGYTQRPPRVSSFSNHYPGNDDKYVKYVKDIGFSLRESVARSLADGRITFARDFCKCESLKDCMDRTIPFYTQVIAPVAQNQNVLIASSENAIRGMLMHLCEIPEDRISEVEIPTGLPLVYLPRMKCLRLLDDGQYDPDPAKALERYNFGTAVELLFQPCDPEKSEFCDINPDGSINNDPIFRLAPEEKKQKIYSTSSTNNEKSSPSLQQSDLADLQHSPDAAVPMI